MHIVQMNEPNEGSFTTSSSIDALHANQSYEICILNLQIVNGDTYFFGKNFFPLRVMNFNCSKIYHTMDRSLLQK